MKIMNYTKPLPGFELINYAVGYGKINLDIDLEPAQYFSYYESKSKLTKRLTVVEKNSIIVLNIKHLFKLNWNNLEEFIVLVSDIHPAKWMDSGKKLHEGFDYLIVNKKDIEEILFVWNNFRLTGDYFKVKELINKSNERIWRQLLNEGRKFTLQKLIDENYNKFYTTVDEGLLLVSELEFNREEFKMIGKDNEDRIFLFEKDNCLVARAS